MSTVTMNRAGADDLRRAPPGWAVTAVQICAVGMLGLPVIATLAGVAALLLQRLGEWSQLGFVISTLLWLALFACAQYLTGRYPPVPRRTPGRLLRR